MTINKLKTLIGRNLYRAETGTGYAIIDTWSYEGCMVAGEYPCFPLTAWAEGFGDGSEIEKYGLSHAVALATGRARRRLNGSHFGTQVWGETGTYTVH